MSMTGSCDTRKSSSSTGMRDCGVSWPSGLVHRTQVLVLSENQNVGSIPGIGTCVLEQDT